MNKAEIADHLEEIAVLLELKGENPFKVRAYRSGARVLGQMEEGELGALIAGRQLDTVKGIGEALAQKITELHDTGHLAFLEKLRASIEPGLIEMLSVPGLGPKKIKALHEQLGIRTLAELSAACEAGTVAQLPGFGEKSQQKLIEGIRNREAYGRRHLWWAARAVAMPIVEGLRKLPQVSRAEAAGSLRRGMETVGDLDFIVASEDVAPVVEWFTSLPQVKEVTAKGETKASVRFEDGLQADLRLVPPAQFAFALHHFTGSKDHNVQMRQRALARGFSLSEWGLTPVDAPPRTGAENAKDVTTETELFAELGLPFIPPELREGLGEIEAAEARALPVLIELGDLRGAFHNHTSASDGHATLHEMVAAADALGWEYIGIADHSKASFQANGLSEERLLRQVDAIRTMNRSGQFKAHVFAGTECDILADGRLDYDDATLAQLDYVVASVHAAINQPEADMTARVIRAIEHPATTMIGHLTARLLLRREGSQVDVGKVIDAAIANGVVIELNADPMRLDMDWRHWRKAAEKGLLCAINPDAHETGGLAHVEAGVLAARKGWLGKEAVLNTRSLEQVKAWLAAHRRARG